MAAGSSYLEGCGTKTNNNSREQKKFIETNDARPPPRFYSLRYRQCIWNSDNDFFTNYPSIRALVVNQNTKIIWSRNAAERCITHIVVHNTYYIF